MEYREPKYINRCSTKQELQDYFKILEEKFDATAPFYQWMDEYIDDDATVEKHAKYLIKLKMHEMAYGHEHHTKKIPKGF